jgi:inner membrane protein
VDNLTHSLVGLAAAKAGLGRLSPYATLVCVAAANLPDVDIVAVARGPAFYLKHHRGITHSLVGVAALAVVFPVLFYACERLAARARGRAARANLKGLLTCSLLLSASHPLLDWTNSYGVRPFLPWDGRWFYGDLLFVVDPWVWLGLGGACFLLARTRARAAGWAVLAAALTVLVFRVSTRPDTTVPAVAPVLWCAGLAAFGVLRWKGTGARFGPGVAATALALLAFYCGALSVVQTRARASAERAARALAAPAGEKVLRVAATPVLADPLAWRCLSETDRSTGRFDLTLARPGAEEPRNVVNYKKPAGEEAEAFARAAQNPDARVLLDFARFPVSRVRREAAGAWVVRLADLRFTEPGAGGRPGGFALDVAVADPDAGLTP